MRTLILGWMVIIASMMVSTPMSRAAGHHHHSLAHKRPHHQIVSHDDLTLKNLIEHPQSPVNCLTAAAFYESRGQSFETQVDIARSVLARSHSNLYPDTVCEVIHQRQFVHHKTICQFTWYCRKPHIKVDKNTYQISYQAALQAMQQDRHVGVFPAMYFNASPHYNHRKFYLVKHTGPIWFVAKRD